jgi:hypothetical protein
MSKNPGSGNKLSVKDEGEANFWEKKANAR